MRGAIGETLKPAVKGFFCFLLIAASGLSADSLTGPRRAVLFSDSSPAQAAAFYARLSVQPSAAKRPDRP
jgi:hypothetical protein